MEAIVLKRRDFREFDQIISFFSKESGKVESLARGVKKTVSKNSAHLEPFSRVFFEVVRGREINHLTKVVPIEYFFNIRNSLEKSLAAGYVVNLVDLSLHSHVADTRIWHLLTSWLEFLDSSKQFTPLLVDSFVISFFSILGFAPVLEKCVVCSKSYKEMIKDELLNGNSEKNTSGLYFAGGGIVCAACRINKEKVGEKVAKSSLKDLSNMQMLQKINFALLVKYEISDEEKKSLHNLVYEFALYHMERNISDWKKLLEIT